MGEPELYPFAVLNGIQLDPRFWQIGDGGGDGPPIPGKSGMGPPSPIPGKSGMAVGMGIGGSVPCTTRPRCGLGRPARLAGGIASSFRASQVRPIQLIRSAHMVGAHSKLTFGLSNMRGVHSGSRAARGWLPSGGRAARPTGSPIARNGPGPGEESGCG